MKRNLKRRNYYLDEKTISRVRAILGTKTEAVDADSNMVVFRKEILKSLHKVAGRGGVEKVFWWQSIRSTQTCISTLFKANKTMCMPGTDSGPPYGGGGYEASNSKFSRAFS